MLCRLILIFWLAGLTVQAADLPPYLKEALSRFHPAIPADWAYTITTVRGQESSVERFDPSLPGEQQWTLLQRNNRPATAEENSRYGSYRLTTSPSSHATFVRGDIDINSLQLVREDEHRAEFRGRFREDLDDQMLRMLKLHLFVTKEPAAVEQFVYQLTGPYSPVLTVKMLELRVETILSPSTGDRPALPQRAISRFRGRVFRFKHIEEDVQTVYSDFARVKPLPSPSATNPP